MINSYKVKLSLKKMEARKIGSGISDKLTLFPPNCFYTADHLSEANGKCIPPMGEPLGLEDGRIPNSSLTSSSHWNYVWTHMASNGRLNYQGVSGFSTGGWVADNADQDKWIKVLVLLMISSLSGVVMA